MNVDKRKRKLFFYILNIFKNNKINSESRKTMAYFAGTLYTIHGEIIKIFEFTNALDAWPIFKWPFSLWLISKAIL